jgi:hypothetical protein
MAGSSISKARQWLQENPSESVATASRIFKVPKSSLQSSITRLSQPRLQQGGLNRVLTVAQVEALKKWIIKQYEQGLGATRQMTFAAVCHIRKPQPPPSQSWLTKFIKNELHDFHIIKTKPIAQQRSKAQDEPTINKWFHDYQQFLLAHQIEPHSIWNMDETGFRIGIPGGEEVIVPCGVTELYTASPENRTSITIIEAVSAIGKATPPVLIIPGKVHMESWYHESLHGTELILLSETGFINDALAMEWLQHFILHTGSTPSSEPKLLLLDSHPSHHTPEFIIRAKEHNIHLYAFPSHLTHILQPLDVGIFQPYKHWHKEAVHSAVRNFDLEYTLRSFMRDLPKIREQTFKESTIIHAFIKAGIWPVSCSLAIAKLQKYSKPKPTLKLTSNTPLTPHTPTPKPTSFRDSEDQLQRWKATLPILLSSPSKESYKNWLIGTEEVLIDGQLQEMSLLILRRQVEEQKNRVGNSRARLQVGGALTVQSARALQAHKVGQEARKQLVKEARVARKAATEARKKLHRAGVEARKQERLRKKRVAALQKAGHLVPLEDQDPITDPEAEEEEEEEEEEGVGESGSEGSLSIEVRIQYSN